MNDGDRGQWPEAIASELRRTFPGYEVVVRRDLGHEPRYQLRSRDDSYPYCVISPDPDEIRAELNGA